MKVKEIIKDNIVLARIIPESAWNKGLGFYSNDADFIQVGTWNYDKGKKLNRHIHNSVKREINRTYEVLYVKKGAIKAQIYDINEKAEEEAWKLYKEGKASSPNAIGRIVEYEDSFEFRLFDRVVVQRSKDFKERPEKIFRDALAEIKFG